MILRFSGPVSLMKSRMSLLENGGPLSLIRISGIPCRANIPSNFGIVDLADVDVTISTSGYLLYASMTTSKYSPVGNGPKKSMFTVCHGAGGNFVIFNGSGRAAGPVA